METKNKKNTMSSADVTMTSVESDAPPSDPVPCTKTTSPGDTPDTASDTSPPGDASKDTLFKVKIRVDKPPKKSKTKRIKKKLPLTAKEKAKIRSSIKRPRDEGSESQDELETAPTQPDFAAGVEASADDSDADDAEAPPTKKRKSTAAPKHIETAHFVRFADAGTDLSKYSWLSSSSMYPFEATPSDFSWWPETFPQGKMKFTCIEQCYQAAKAGAFSHMRTYKKIMGAPSSVKILPRYYRTWGKKVEMPNGCWDQDKWDSLRFDIMIFAQTAKFRAHPDLLDKLLETGRRTIVFCSPGSKRWGIGMGATHGRSVRPDKWRGENLLGQALQQVRDTMRAPPTGISKHAGAAGANNDIMGEIATPEDHKTAYKYNNVFPYTSCCGKGTADPCDSCVCPHGYVETCSDGCMLLSTCTDTRNRGREKMRKMATEVEVLGYIRAGGTDKQFIRFATASDNGLLHALRKSDETIFQAYTRIMGGDRALIAARPVVTLHSIRWTETHKKALSKRNSNT